MLLRNNAGGSEKKHRDSGPYPGTQTASAMAEYRPPPSAVFTQYLAIFLAQRCLGGFGSHHEVSRV